MITLTREEAQKILDALEYAYDNEMFVGMKVILRAKLSEPEPEPVAYIDVETRNLSWAKLTRWETPTVVKMDKVPLYTAPPKKEWVGLTNEEIEDIRLEYHYADGAVKVGYERAIEAKLKEKNGG
jgi:hypothetical protein